MTSNDPTEIPRHVARKFAHLAVVANDPNALHNSIDFLVQEVLLEKGGGNASVVRRNLEEYFHLKFEEEEISESLQRSREAGKVLENREIFTLDSAQEGYLKKLNSDTRAVERKIYQNWAADISQKYPELTELEEGALVDDLKVYLYKLFLHNGAECMALVNPTFDGQVVDRSSAELLRLLPPRTPKISHIRRIEFPRFLGDADAERRRYFATLLDGTFVYQIIQTDPETLRVIKENFKSYVLYLDTNILFSVLGLRDLRHATTIGRGLDLAKSFGMKFVVSTKTVEELQFSLLSQTESLMKSAPVRRDLAEIGADMSEEDSLTTAYWRAFAKTGITKEDFLERLRHSSDLLKAKDIAVVDDHFIPSKKTLRAEKDLLNKSILTKKPENVAEHDAYHSLLINHLRERAIKTNTSKRFWFLSWDFQLARYANRVRKIGEAGFVYLPHQLVQMLRIYTERTADYDETFLELFTRPQIKSAQNVIPNDFAEKILTKISSFADLPEELAVKIMLDSGFIARIENKEDSEINSEISKEIELRVNKQLSDLGARVRDLEIRNAQSSKEKEEIQATASTTIGAKSRESELLRTALLVVSVLFFLLIASLFYDKLWNHLSLIPRLIALAIFIVGILGICSLKWNVGVTLGHLSAIAGIGTVGFGIAYFNLPKPEEAIVDTSKQEIVATSSTPEIQLGTSTDGDLGRE